MIIPIPPDEALQAAFHSRGNVLHIDRLRDVATLAAKQAAEQAVKEAVLRIDDRLSSLLPPEGGVRTDLREWYPFAFAPTPPKEQQPVPEASPSPDPATVRMCIEAVGGVRYLSRATAIQALESLLPKPTPAPEPERYVTIKEVSEVLDGIGIGIPLVDANARKAILGWLDGFAAKRGPMLTPDAMEESLIDAMRKEQPAGYDHFSKGYSFAVGTLVKAFTALRLAAKQGGVA